MARGHVLNVKWFKNAVNYKKPWDYKVKAKKYKYLFNGKVYTPEQFGNIHYGAVGTAAVFSSLTLLAAAGYAQLGSIGWGINKKSTLIINSILAYTAIAVFDISYIRSIPVYNYTFLDIEVDSIIPVMGNGFIFLYINYLEKQLKIDKKISYIGVTCFFIILIGSFIFDIMM